MFRIKWKSKTMPLNGIVAEEFPKEVDANECAYRMGKEWSNIEYTVIEVE